jgi:hypothetical protein
VAGLAGKRTQASKRRTFTSPMTAFNPAATNGLAANGDIVGTRIEDWVRDWGSREAALKSPTSFKLSAYLYKNHNLPKQFANSEIVYHYTDAAGFLGIISSGRFWATNADFLNDPSETTFALAAVDSF